MAIDPNIPLSVTPHRAPNMLQMLLAVEDMRQRQRYGQEQEADRAMRREELTFRREVMEADAAAAKAETEQKTSEIAAEAEADRQHAFVRAVGSLKARPPEERAARYPALIAQLRAADKLPSGQVPETWEGFGGDTTLDEFIAQAMTNEQFGAAFGPQKPPPAAPVKEEYELEEVLPDGSVRKRLVPSAEYRQGVTQPPRSATSTAGGFTIGRTRYNADGSVLVKGELPPAAQDKLRNVTSGDAGRIADFDTSLSDLKVLKSAITETANATGTSATIGVNLPFWVTDATGWGTDAKKRQGVIDRVKQVIGKTLEGGVLRKEDEYKYEKILPTIKDPQEVAKAKLTGLDTAIAQRRQTFLQAIEDAGYDTTKYDARSATPPPPPPGPKVGERRTINGQRAVWDGKGWLPVGK